MNMPFLFDFGRSEKLAGVVSTSYETAGFMRKRGRMVPTWKTRYFVLQHNNFYYFNDQYRTVCLGHDTVVSVEVWDDKKFGMLLTSGSGRVFRLVCFSELDRDIWLTAFRQSGESRESQHLNEDNRVKSYSADDNSEQEASPPAMHFSRSGTVTKKNQYKSRRSLLGIEHFKLISTIGKGGFGKVLKVSKLDKCGNETGKVYAMKILKKEFIVKHKMRRTTMLERQILLDIDFPFIVKLHYAFQSSHKLYMVMDYYGGGSLYYHLEREGRFDEITVQFFAGEMMLAVQHLHENGVLYRDLKLENVLLDSRGHVALTDFGLSKEINPSENKLANTFCGTPLYVAPEMVYRRRYGFAVDWWAFGIIVYELSSGRVPFSSRSAEKVLWKIVNATPHYAKELFSDKVRDFIEGLLQKNPSRRLGSGVLGVKNIQNHPFFDYFDFDKCLRKEIDPPFRPPATYQGEKNVRGVEAKDTEDIDLSGESEEFDHFTYCKSSEFLPVDLRSEDIKSEESKFDENSIDSTETETMSTPEKPLSSDPNPSNSDINSGSLCKADEHSPMSVTAYV